MAFNDVQKGDITPFKPFVIDPHSIYVTNHDVFGERHVCALDGANPVTKSHNCYKVATDDALIAILEFQNGSPKVNGHNGWTIEDLLVACAHRLACFQQGPMACAHNHVAILRISQAIDALNSRTQGRVVRGVEGEATP